MIARRPDAAADWRAAGYPNAGRWSMRHAPALADANAARAVPTIAEEVLRRRRGGPGCASRPRPEDCQGARGES
jgi:hypothetical protein